MKKDTRTNFAVIFANVNPAAKWAVTIKAHYVEEAIVLAIDQVRNEGKGFNSVECLAVL